MNDSVAAWMIAGGARTDQDERNMRHLIAIRVAREAARADRPSILDRVRAQFGIPASTPAVDCCVA